MSSSNPDIILEDPTNSFRGILVGESNKQNHNPTEKLQALESENLELQVKYDELQEKYDQLEHVVKLLAGKLARMEEEKGDLIVSKMSRKDLVELGGLDEDIVKILDYLEKRGVVFVRDLVKLGIDSPNDKRGRRLIQRVGKIKGYSCGKKENGWWYAEKEENVNHEEDPDYLVK